MTLWWEKGKVSGRGGWIRGLKLEGFIGYTDSWELVRQ